MSHSRSCALAGCEADVLSRAMSRQKQLQLQRAAYGGVSARPTPTPCSLSIFFLLLATLSSYLFLPQTMETENSRAGAKPTAVAPAGGPVVRRLGAAALRDVGLNVRGVRLIRC